MAQYDLKAGELHILIAALGGGLNQRMNELTPEQIVEQCEKMLAYAKDLRDQMVAARAPVEGRGTHPGAHSDA